MNYKVSPEEALKKIDAVGRARFAVMMKHGSMSIEYFTPKKYDIQTPHTQDEIYVINKGEATFYRDGERVPCTKGDVLFVPAGIDHRFENFSDDFETWVIFYGPEGGETS